MPGEAVAKHVAILTITGREFKSEPIRLKSVRPFVMKEIVLSEEAEAMKLAKKANNRPELTRFLESIVEDMIEEANQEWIEAQKARQGENGESDGHAGELGDDGKPPLPLIRLRVEYSAPDGGQFDCENPQRFSGRFQKKVANTQDVVQFHRRKAAGRKKVTANGTALPDESALQSFAIDSVQIEKLVKEFLDAQALTLLPQNQFENAVIEFVDKDDKHAMEQFLEDNLDKQLQHILGLDHVDEDTMQDAIEQGITQVEELLAKGQKPQPEDCVSYMNGPWNEYPRSTILSDPEDDNYSDVTIAKPPAKGRGRQAAAAKKGAPAKKQPAKNSRSKKQIVEDESDEDEDMLMGNGVEEEESEDELFVKPGPAPRRGGRKAAAPPAKKAPTRAAKAQAPRQSQLAFSQATKSQSQMKPKVEISGDEISDDDDAFEPVASTARSGRGTRAKR